MSLLQRKYFSWLLSIRGSWSSSQSASFGVFFHPLVTRECHFWRRKCQLFPFVMRQSASINKNRNIIYCAWHCQIFGLKASGGKFMMKMFAWRSIVNFSRASKNEEVLVAFSIESEIRRTSLLLPVHDGSRTISWLKFYFRETQETKIVEYCPVLPDVFGFYPNLHLFRSRDVHSWDA